MRFEYKEPAETAGSSLFPALPECDTALDDTVRALFAPGSRPGAVLLGTLRRFGLSAVRFALTHGVRIVLVHRRRYSDASPALARLGIDVDTWPAPPAGLFVVEERTVYLRSQSPMTLAHEFAHALDCALGGGVYLSGSDPGLRAIFNAATAFVTPYQATGIDEFWAEAVRAYVDECNDPTSHWPEATRSRLRTLQPAMYEYIDRVFTVDIPQRLEAAAWSIPRRSNEPLSLLRYEEDVNERV